jgi:hypothetical protein
VARRLENFIFTNTLAAYETRPCKLIPNLYLGHTYSMAGILIRRCILYCLFIMPAVYITVVTMDGVHHKRLTFGFEDEAILVAFPLHIKCIIGLLFLLFCDTSIRS